MKSLDHVAIMLLKMVYVRIRTINLHLKEILIGFADVQREQRFPMSDESKSDFVQLSLLCPECHNKEKQCKCSRCFDCCACNERLWLVKPKVDNQTHKRWAAVYAADMQKAMKRAAQMLRRKAEDLHALPITRPDTTKKVCNI